MKCFIFHIEQYNEDDLNDHYDIMNILLVNTIREFYDEPIFAFNLKRVKIQDHLISEFKRLNVTVIEDPIFVDDGTEQYFLRNYVMSYAIEKDYLKTYSQLIYLDIDVVVLGIIPEKYFSGIIFEPIPKYVFKQESPFLPKDFEQKLYYNWFQVINENNKDLFRATNIISRVDKHSDNDVSCDINNTSKFQNIRRVRNDEAFYPMKAPLKDSSLFHYDSFKSEGSLIFLKDANPVMYKFISDLLDKYNVTFSKDTTFWNYFISEYMKNRKLEKKI